MNSTDKSALKIHTSSTDKLGTKLLYEAIVFMAKERGIAGVTVYRGIMGYGLSSHISSSRYWELTEKLPVMIEIIDDTEILENFFKFLEHYLLKTRKGILITLEPVKVLLHKSGEIPT
jgi:PII-like signaling protein